MMRPIIQQPVRVIVQQPEVALQLFCLICYR
jgi:hypothetical protein